VTVTDLDSAGLWKESTVELRRTRIHRNDVTAVVGELGDDDRRCVLPTSVEVA
jgi:hypothetical protein